MVESKIKIFLACEDWEGLYLTGPGWKDHLNKSFCAMDSFGRLVDPIDTLSE